MSGIWIALGVLPVAGVLATPPPEGLGEAGWATLGCAATMALWWMTGAIPLAATALIPLALFPLIGVAGMTSVAAAYAHPLIFLFLGGFILGKALEQRGVAAWLGARIVRRAAGRPAFAVGGLMAVTAFLSLWISNTATAMIMAPIAASVVAGGAEQDETATAALLGVAFAATIGGMGSLIGTPPNALFAAYAGETLGLSIGFAEWAALGLPVVAIFLPLAFLVLTRLVFTLGPTLAGPVGAPVELDAAARRVLAVAGLAALGWICRPLLEAWPPTAGVTDAGIAVAAALALFLLPGGRGERLLNWEDAATIRWDVLILFGGGLALAGAIDGTGAAAWMASLFAAGAGFAPFLLVIGFAAVIVAAGELASNTAMAAIFLPVAGAAAAGVGADPLLLVTPIALAASVGFMLPVATPPNAIVFAYPPVTRARMLAAGAPLDLIGIGLAAGIGYWLAPIVFGG